MVVTTKAITRKRCMTNPKQSMSFSEDMQTSQQRIALPFSGCMTLSRYLLVKIHDSVVSIVTTR